MAANNVRKLDISNLRNIPAMLEQWAEWLRNDAEEQPSSMLVILIPPGEEDPELCIFGEDMKRAEVAGHLLACANRHVRLGLEDED